MNPIYLSAISYVHGAALQLVDLVEQMPVDLTLPVYGLANYRVSDLEIWQIAAIAAGRTRATSCGTPDLLLYVTENDRAATESLAQLARQINLPNIKCCAISGHACGNLGPALELARNAIECRRHNQILLVTADRALTHGRLLQNGLSVLSDGGAACIISREASDLGAVQFAVHAITTTTDVNTDPTDPSRFNLSTIKLGMAGIEEVIRETGLGRDGFQYVIFPNYRLLSQRVLTAAMGFPEDRLLLGPIAEFGHSFSSDILVNLNWFAASGIIKRHDHLLVSSIGPYTWSMMDVECL